MDIKILGTGNALVTECYNTCFVLDDDGKYFMVDGGGGSQILSRLKQAGIDVNDIHEIFVTHKHIDHLLGIIWMVRVICQNMRQGKYEGEARIYGHGEVIGILRSEAERLLQKKDMEAFDKTLHFVIVEDGEERMIDGKKITFFDVGSTKAKQFGFCMETEDGKKLTCCGDEPYNEREYKYAYKSTWLLHEAFCLYGQRDVFHPYEKHHSTAKDASELAETLEVENLILYHTEDKNIEKRKELYTAEGKEYYSGNLFVPDDLETIRLW